MKGKLTKTELEKVYTKVLGSYEEILKPYTKDQLIQLRRYVKKEEANGRLMAFELFTDNRDKEDYPDSYDTLYDYYKDEVNKEGGYNFIYELIKHVINKDPIQSND